MRAAVPAYVGRSFHDCPPGHRFRLYLELWNADWTARSPQGGDTADNKSEALERVVQVPRPVRELMTAFAERQTGVAATLPDAGVFRRKGWNIAPLTTGLGIEHPLENGFAFLDPYGLPYLPGSSVKGVLRRAAEELALFEADCHGWTIAAVWWLFGFDANSGFFTSPVDGEAEAVTEERRRWQRAYLERGAEEGGGELLHRFIERVAPGFERQGGPAGTGAFLDRLQLDERLRHSIHLRGSMDFWDVMPLLRDEGTGLHIDIMNSHYGDYYQRGQPPGDWSDPNPVTFLGLPPGCEFRFVVRFHPVARFPCWLTSSHDGRPRWQQLLAAAFDHAFAWLGFGAKTCQGYGLMSRNPKDAELEVVEERLEVPKGIRQGPCDEYLVQSQQSTGGAQKKQPAGLAEHPLFARADDFQFNRAKRHEAVELLREIEKVSDPAMRLGLVQLMAEKVRGSAQARMVWGQFPELDRMKG